MFRIRIYGLLIALFALLAPGTAGPPARPHGIAGESSITVRLYAMFPDALPHLPRAIEEADLVFRKAGLRVRWLDCSGPDRETPCDETAGRKDIRLRIVAGRGRRDLGDALGYAMATKQGGVYATAFFGAVTEVRRGMVVSTAQVLGHVIAHEVGHLLLGDSRHSRGGLMSASWNDRELRKIARREMRFTGRQMRQILEGARARMLDAGHTAVAAARFPGASDGNSGE
jgi:hypothetical protein